MNELDNQFLFIFNMSNLVKDIETDSISKISFPGPDKLSKNYLYKENNSDNYYESRNKLYTQFLCLNKFLIVLQNMHFLLLNKINTINDSNKKLACECHEGMTKINCINIDFMKKVIENNNFIDHHKERFEQKYNIYLKDLQEYNLALEKFNSDYILTKEFNHDLYLSKKFNL